MLSYARYKFLYPIPLAHSPFLTLSPHARVLISRKRCPRNSSLWTRGKEKFPFQPPPVPCVVLGKVGESRRKAHHSCLALFSTWMEKQGEGNSMPCRPECGPLFSEARRGWERKRESGGKGSRTRKFGGGKGEETTHSVCSEEEEIVRLGNACIDVCAHDGMWCTDIRNRWEGPKEAESRSGLQLDLTVFFTVFFDRT